MQNGCPVPDGLYGVHREARWPYSSVRHCMALDKSLLHTPHMQKPDADKELVKQE